MGLLLVLLILALVCFGVGFTVHWLFIAAVVLLIFALFAGFTNR